jgi:predicted DNA-binding transcriptional regulator YafY
LVAVLLLLQRRSHVTAAEVAEELEISERTARRDLEALSLAGLPVFSRQGRGGGWELLGGSRTDLSGLNASEARALFMVAGPSSSATPDVKSALRKLVRALPEPFRDEAEAASTAVVLDPTSWGRAPHSLSEPAHLDELKHAVVAGHQIRLAYVDRERAETERVVDPLGLASKGPHWYLVAGTPSGLRSFRVDRVRSIVVTDTPVVRPPGFDLDTEWDAMKLVVESRRAPFVAQGSVAGTHIGILRAIFGSRLTEGDRALDRIAIEMRSNSAAVLAKEIAGFVEVLDITSPPEVLRELASIGYALTVRYGAS